MKSPSNHHETLFYFYSQPFPRCKHMGFLEVFIFLWVSSYISMVLFHIDLHRNIPLKKLPSLVNIQNVGQSPIPMVLFHIYLHNLHRNPSKNCPAWSSFSKRWSIPFGTSLKKIHRRGGALVKLRDTSTNGVGLKAGFVIDKGWRENHGRIMGEGDGIWFIYIM